MLFKNTKQEKIILESISLLFILLFVYAGISKLLEFQDFQTQLGQSPLLAAFAIPVSYGVIGVELITSLLLVFENTRKWGLYLSFLLMVMFTTYIVIILNFTSFTPCSCGGVLEAMGWTEHVIFNIGFIALACISLVLHHKISGSLKNPLTKKINLYFPLLVLFLFGVITVTTLHLLSENKIHRNNAFQRKYLPHPVTTIKGISLPYNSYYIAGFEKGRIYLGNKSAPAHLLSIDTTLNNLKTHQIILNNNLKTPFFAPQIKIKNSRFFVIDGEVPIIYKGLLDDWKAELIWHGKPSETFSRVEIASQSLFVFSGLDKSSSQNVIGRINFNAFDTVAKSQLLLKKQIGGIFDTDGMLRFNQELNRLLYVYYYRNEFLTSDTKLNLDYLGRTIDTVKTATIKIITEKSGQIQTLENQPLIINKECTTFGEYVFIKSDRLGKYEPEEMLKDASIIDVYNLKTKSYDFSFYLYHYKGEKIKNFTVYENMLVGLSEKHLVLFRLQSNFFNI
ncbi:DoxX family protein [Mesoflavibacter zeaxanthinifaciens]|uniref:DoxX family protein n=1 Tax=Mesoflavibacter zeaxanthinifaciens TaxID=393060 RepID=UPI003A8CCFD2